MPDIEIEFGVDANKSAHASTNAAGIFNDIFVVYRKWFDIIYQKKYSPLSVLRQNGELSG